MSLNLNAALSSFIAASPRIVHHSETQHWKKKNIPLTCLTTKTLSVCEPSILIVVVVARAGLFMVRQIREWATYVFIYLFIYFYFALRHRPLSLPQPPPHRCCVGAGSESAWIWNWAQTFSAIYCLNNQLIGHTRATKHTCQSHVPILLVTWAMGGFKQKVLSSKLCIRSRWKYL